VDGWLWQNRRRETPEPIMDEPQADARSDLTPLASPLPAGGWALTPAAFRKLLGFLDSDPARAAEAYERTRRKLTRLFEWRGCQNPEDLVDETMNRVARKIDQGEKILTQEPYHYFCGVARFVFHELIRRQQRQRTALEQERWTLTSQTDPEDNFEAERRLSCLQRGLRSLPESHRELILRYYQGEKSRKIAIRRELAAELGIQLNALRIRAHRIRQKLESRVRDCLKSSEH